MAPSIQVYWSVTVIKMILTWHPCLKLHAGAMGLCDVIVLVFNTKAGLFFLTP